MTASSADNLRLSFDISGTEALRFGVILTEPSFALQTALRELQGGLHSDAEDLDAIVYSVASKVSGRCAFNGSPERELLEACLVHRIVMEWSLKVPKAGELRALFHLGRLTAVEGKTDLFDIALRLSGRPRFQRLDPSGGDGG